MLEFLQDFYFSLYISTWTSFKWLLLSILIAIGCCLATFLFEFKGKTAQLICSILFIHDTSWHHPFNRNPSRCCFQFLFPSIWFVNYLWYYPIHHQSFQSIVLILHGKEIMRGNLFSRCYNVKKIKKQTTLEKSSLSII